jgi:hypothetical protein
MHDIKILQAYPLVTGKDLAVKGGACGQYPFDSQILDAKPVG